jgi:hypothetical protein
MSEAGLHITQGKVEFHTYEILKLVVIFMS